MIHDRLSWLRFLGLSFGDQTPDENTIRHFRNRLIATGTLTRVMKAFDWQLQKKGYIPMSGQIVDASLVPLQSSAIPRANARRSSLGRARKKSGRTNRTRPLSKATARANAAKSSSAPVSNMSSLIRRTGSVVYPHDRPGPCRSEADPLQPGLQLQQADLPRTPGMHGLTLPANRQTRRRLSRKSI